MNLVGASRAVIVDQDWNPCHVRQAVYRCYRYGQTKPVTVYFLIGMKFLFIFIVLFGMSVNIFFVRG